MSVGEDGVDNPVIGNAEHEFVGGYAGQQRILAPQALVSGVIEIEEVSEMLIIIGNSCKNTASVGRVFRRDEAVSVVLSNGTEWRKAGGFAHDIPSSDTAASGVEQAADRLHRGKASADHVLERSSAGKNTIGIGQPDPFIGQLSAIEYVERFENTD